MTLRSPEENSPLRWISEIGLRPRDIVVAALTIVGAYCTMQIRMSTVAEQQAEQARQIDLLTREQAQKLDKETYQVDQQHLQLQLNDISVTVHDINQFLLNHPRP